MELVYRKRTSAAPQEWPQPEGLKRLSLSIGGGNGNPLQHSCLENPIDRGAWQATIHVSYTTEHAHTHASLSKEVSSAFFQYTCPLGPSHESPSERQGLVTYSKWTRLKSGGQSVPPAPAYLGQVEGRSAWTESMPIAIMGPALIKPVKAQPPQAQKPAGLSPGTSLSGKKVKVLVAQAYPTLC